MMKSLNHSLLSNDLDHLDLTLDGAAKDGKSFRQAQIAVAVVPFVAILLMLAFNPSYRPLYTLFLAALVVGTGLFPLYRWLGDERRSGVPVVEMQGLFYVITFGIAGFLEPGQMFGLDWVAEDYRQACLLMVCLSLISMYTGYWIVGRSFGGKVSQWRWKLEARASGYRLLALQIYPLLLVVNLASRYLEFDALKQIFLSTQTFVFLWLACAYLSGKLRDLAKWLFPLYILPTYLYFASGLDDAALAGSLMIALNLGIAFVHTRRQIPFAAIFCVAGFFFLLQPVKAEFRTYAWVEQVELTRLEKAKLFFDLGINYYFSNSAGNAAIELGATSAYDRLNILQPTAAIIEDTPRIQPFQYGETYLPILTKWIPRFLWAEKPLENLGNRWAQRYGYLGLFDTWTAFNLSWLGEMYMNFGLAGVILISMVLGVVFHTLSKMLWRGSRGPGAYAFGLLIGVPLMVVETNLSLIVGALIIACVSATLFSALVLLVFPKHFFKDVGDKVFLSGSKLS